jgi:hypothetical protein
MIADLISVNTFIHMQYANIDLVFLEAPKIGSSFTPEPSPRGAASLRKILRGDSFQKSRP